MAASNADCVGDVPAIITEGPVRKAPPLLLRATVRILIVEDEAVLRKNLARLLARAGHEVVTASSRIEAVGALSRSRFEMLLIDVQLPDGNGLDVVAGLNGGQRPLWTFVMTSAPGYEARARVLDVQRLLRKPLDLAQLVNLVGAASTASPC